MNAAKGQFRRDWLPIWPTYAQQHDIVLRGHGAEQRTRCGIHGGERDSLCVNVNTGAWQCKACGAAGGDVLAFHQAVNAASFVEAARALGAWDEHGVERPPNQRRVGAVPRPAAAPAASEADGADMRKKRVLAARWWRQSLPIDSPNSPAAKYLLGRNCVLPPADSDLRWLPDLRLFGFSGPALIGRMSLVTDYQKARGLHLTWLKQDGGTWRRAERRYLGPKANCVVRLWLDEAITLGLGIGEGVESSLSLAPALTPVWAALDAGNLAALPVLAGVESLTIAGDHDDAGIAAAERCAARWAKQRCEVRIVMAEAGNADLNDVARLPA